MVRKIARKIFDKFVSKERLLKEQRKLQFKLGLVENALNIKNSIKTLVVTHDGEGQNLEYIWQDLRDNLDISQYSDVVCSLPEDQAKMLAKYINQG